MEMKVMPLSTAEKEQASHLSSTNRSMFLATEQHLTMTF